MNAYLYSLVAVLFGGVIFWVVADAGVTLWERFRPKEKAPALWKLTLADPDGIPFKSAELSAHGVARLISDLNAGYYK